MHKAVLLDLDSRPGAIKMSFDCSNAHNEFSRCAAAAEIERDLPDLLPWVVTSLTVTTTHAHVGTDGHITHLAKGTGGDQGDAITAMTFPMAYRVVSRSVECAARAA